MLAPAGMLAHFHVPLGWTDLLKRSLKEATDDDETYGTIGGVMVLLLWFYLSGIAILLGAELNAEIEHASPYGKGEVPGQRKMIGVRAMRAYEEREARGEAAATTFAGDVNRDVDRAAASDRAA